MTNIRIALVALAPAMLAGGGAAAQDYAAKTLGAWTVAASRDGQGCFLTRSYAGEGGTTLLLGMDRDGSNHLSVLNDNWSIKPQQRLKLNFRLTRGGYPNQAVVGLAADGKRGFVTAFEQKFPGYFAASKALHIDRGGVPVEKLDLEGSGAAVAELQRCVAAQTGPKARAAGAARASDIPRDPFAPDAGHKRKKRDSAKRSESAAK